MADDISHAKTSSRGHPLPRRSTPEESVTLHHHRLAHEASKRIGNDKQQSTLTPQQQATASPRRDSSGESNEIDPKTWFERQNNNPVGNYDASMDVDPPFFQKETDSSNGEREGGNTIPDATFPFDAGLQVPLRQTVTHSSSADDYRSVIDDLTIENKRLKEELKRYKQYGPPMMQKEKLFEIKVHGLPKRKKRELEATLRDFAASLEGSSDSPSGRKSSRQEKKNMYSSGDSKHTSSSSSHSRPVDSAYASMSTGPSSHAPNSIGRSLGRPSVGSRTKSSQQKVESYLRDTPDGLFPRQMVMTEKEKKKLVVRRLEQLFTGKISGRNMHRNQSMSSLEPPASPADATMGPPKMSEASREAYIQPIDPSQKKSRSRDNASTSNEDQTESGGNGHGSGDGNGSGGRSGNNTSPPSVPLPEQRPARPVDLDPDRLQIPSENLKYIQHLGLVPQEFFVSKTTDYVDVAPDADGWVYLNLLGNLAQLHMLNVTPGFIRAAVSEKSAKFQLSPDGRKVRWRGGTDGTRFSSDSGDNSQKSPSTATDDTDGSNEAGQRKKSKKMQGGQSDSKFGPQASSRSDLFHYKPLFVHRTSSAETSVEGTGSQASDGAEDSNVGNSKYGYSGSGSSQRKKRRHDGAIIYYSGAPFCTDLSGDPGDTSPTTYMTSTGRDYSSLDSAPHSLLQRSLSGSSLVIRPLSDARPFVSETLSMEFDRYMSGDEETDDEMEFPWSDSPGMVRPKMFETPLEPCGLGGVVPEDHFAVMVTTRRPIHCVLETYLRENRSMSEDAAEAIARRLEITRTSSPLPPPCSRTSGKRSPVHIEYLEGRMVRLKPTPLPPPAMYLPPSSSDSETDSGSIEIASTENDDMEHVTTSQSLISRRANPYLSDARMEEEDGSDESEEPITDVKMGMGEVVGRDDSGDALRPPADRVESSSTGKVNMLIHPGSSVATAGGDESGYSSSMEDDAFSG
ncbi:putative frequency clock protein [Triangularia verruculosa]|uniref:Frequency clock protein n=1 Tax=Triangularia verruculosa TaxID=2587418 RepID=A0AAN7APP6_9PEZI|nr:putative frequency clock protein [Triangularia verruculosa]